VFELPFNGEMASMTDEGFVRDVLVDGLGVSHVSVGFDFRFGRGRMGHAQRLASLGRALGFGVTIVDEVIELEGKASSTAIRQALHAGEPEVAAELLGTWWIADGVVESGEKNGRTLGFPTANLHLGELIHPRHGIYAVRARVDRQGEWLDGVANFGRTPTTGHPRSAAGNAYFRFRRRSLRQVAGGPDGVLHPARAEIFDSLDALVEAMHADAAEARKRLANL
jgi:riboflavin kinase/FMN adenylyltransferase